MSPSLLPLLACANAVGSAGQSRRSGSSSLRHASDIRSSSDCTRVSKPRLASTLSWSTSRAEISCSTSSANSLHRGGLSSTPPKCCLHSSTFTRTASSIGESSWYDSGPVVDARHCQGPQARQHPADPRWARQGRRLRTLQRGHVVRQVDVNVLRYSRVHGTRGESHPLRRLHSD